MPPGSNEMHYIAQRLALEEGPREFNIRGNDRIAYGLTKAELKKLFHNYNYNTTTGSRWRSSIIEWLDEDLHGDMCTIDPDLITNKREDLKWAVVFLRLDPDDMTRLRVTAENEGMKTWPTLEMWDHVCGY